MTIPSLAEISKKLETVEIVVCKHLGNTYEYIRIRACEARDRNGQPANWPASDPRRPIQLKVTRRRGKPKVTYTNYW
jgi:hypothetical protein